MMCRQGDRLEASVRPATALADFASLCFVKRLTRTVQQR
jgi:hypothetical protein